MSTTIAAIRAEDFVQSIGVNTHMSWQSAGYAWASPANVEADIAYLGIYHVRDAAPLSWTLGEYQALANTGVKFDLLTNGGTVDFAADLAGADSLAATNPGSIATIEGPNEINLSPIVYDGVSSADNLAIGTAAQAALYALVHADPLLAGVQVVDLSLGVASQAQYDALGNIAAYADIGNFHTYFANGVAPAALLAAQIAEARTTTPGKPVVVTETGYYTAVQATDWGGVNQDVQAKQTLDALLDAYKDGSSITFIYDLMDNISNPAADDREDSFGLFNADGSPKPAATALHNLTAVLSDTAATARSFTAGGLAYSLGNLPGTGNSLLMQKAGGVFDLVVWNEPTLWNEATLSENTIAATDVTVNLGATFRSVSVYDPLVGTAPIASYSNVSVLVIGLSDHPLVIQASGPVTTGSTPGTTTLGAAGGTVVSTNADHIATGSGNATVTASANATITGGTGALSVQLTGSGASVTGGAGNLTLTDAKGGNTIVTGSGTNTLTIAAGGDKITANGWANAIDLGAGSSTISVFGNAQIIGGSGTATITARGSWTSVTTGTGSTSITFLSGAGYVQTHGTDSITATANTGGSISIDAEGPATSVAGGSGGLWFVGNGNATVTTGAKGSSTFSPGTGTDFFKTYANTSNTFWLGSGTSSIYSSGHDTVHGGTGATTVTQSGTGTTLVVYGGTAAMQVNAGGGNTSLVGGTGALTVSGSGGTMEVQAGSGAVSVLFGHGNSTVAGGAGADLFTFRGGSGGGTQLIQNFVAGQDHLHLTGYAGNQAAVAVAGGHATAAGFTMSLADGTTIVMAGLSRFSTSSFA